MKRMVLIIMTAALQLTLTACGARQEPLETWPITYSNSIVCYVRDYPDIASMQVEGHIIFHGKAVALVEEGQYGVILELEPIASTGDGSGNILLRQTKDPGIVLKKGEEVVLILRPAYDEGVWEGFNGDCGIFRLDEGTGNVTGARLDSLLESAPEKYAGKKLTLEQVYDILVELDKAE